MDRQVNGEIILCQKKELSEYRDELEGIKRKLKNHRQNLNSHWRGMEMADVNNMLEDMEKRFRRIANQLEDLEYLMNSAYEDMLKRNE